MSVNVFPASAKQIRAIYKCKVNQNYLKKIKKTNISVSLEYDADGPRSPSLVKSIDSTTFGGDFNFLLVL